MGFIDTIMLREIYVFSFILLSCIPRHGLAMRSSVGLSSIIREGGSLRRVSSCRWQKDHCAPTYAQLFQSNSPPLSSFSARGVASALALGLYCSDKDTSGSCHAPCVWDERRGCHLSMEESLRVTLACPESEVSEMTSCGFTSWSGFDWDHAEPQTSSSSSLATTIARRLLSGRGATICPKGCVEVGGASGASSAPVTSSGRGGRQRDSNTCAAGFFAAMKVKGEKEGWMVSSRRGDPSAWGCCQGSILATQILACHRLSPATCALSGTCQLHGDECDITPEALSKVAFASEAEEGMGREEAPSADLARQLLSLPSRCARLGVEECNQATVDVDPRRVSEYISLPFLSDDVEPAAGAQGGVLHDNHPIDNPDVCVRASERAAKELESFLADDGDIVIDLPAEDGPHEDEDVVF